MFCCRIGLLTSDGGFQQGITTISRKAKWKDAYVETIGHVNSLNFFRALRPGPNTEAWAAGYGNAVVPLIQGSDYARLPASTFKLLNENVMRYVIDMLTPYIPLPSLHGTSRIAWRFWKERAPKFGASRILGILGRNHGFPDHAYGMNCMRTLLDIFQDLVTGMNQERGIGLCNLRSERMFTGSFEWSKAIMSGMKCEDWLKGRKFQLIRSND